jgi:anti-anti-sigma factor
MNSFLIEREGTKVKVILGAELIVAVVPELRELLCAIQDDGVTQVTLDFSKTAFLDTAGLSLLLAARNSFSGGDKSLSLAGVQPALFELFRTLRLEQRLNAHME